MDYRIFSIAHGADGVFASFLLITVVTELAFL